MVDHFVGFFPIVLLMNRFRSTYCKIFIYDSLMYFIMEYYGLSCTIQLTMQHEPFYHHLCFFFCLWNHFTRYFHFFCSKDVVPHPPAMTCVSRCVSEMNLFRHSSFKFVLPMMFNHSIFLHSSLFVMTCSELLPFWVWHVGHVRPDGRRLSSNEGVEYVDEVSGEVKEARASQEVVKLDRSLGSYLRWLN